MKRYRRAYIEISNICNLQCSFCPEVERAKHVMELERFERVVAEAAPLVDEVCLHLMGEPLHHPAFAEIIAACARHGVPVNLTTNATLLNGARRAVALHPIVRQVNISAHSFAANFPGVDVTPYARRILDFARQALTERPDLYVNLRLWDLAEPTALSSENAALRRLIETEFAVALDGVDVRRKKRHPLAGRVAVNFDSRFTWPSPQLPRRTDQGFCHGLGNHFGVHADGTVVPCCLDKEAVLALGNCASDPLAEVLEGPRATKIRDGFQRGELVEDLCRRCPFVARFDRKAKSLRGSRHREVTPTAPSPRPNAP